MYSFFIIENHLKVFFVHRQSQDFVNYYNAMIGFKNAASYTMPTSQEQNKLTSE